MRQANAWLIGMGLLIAGCAKPGAEVAPAASSAAETSAPVTNTPAVSTAQAAVPLDILSFEQIQERIASKKGKVVVVDAWSTSCPPCMKDFHNLVELHKEHGPEKLACISLSFDFEGGKDAKPEDVVPQVQEFLASQGATFDNLLSNEESDVLYRKFKLNAVPAVFVYDQQGALKERFEAEGAYEKVKALVAELLAALAK